MKTCGAKSFLKKAKVQILMHPIIFSSLGKTCPIHMISSSQIKLIRSLRLKKQRDRQRLYVVEGDKMTEDLLDAAGQTAHHPVHLFATGRWIDSQAKRLAPVMDRVVVCTEKELLKISNLVTPQPVVCLVAMPEEESRDQQPPAGPVLVFESIRDPGNLGTIMRTASWFGINYLVCSPDSVDRFNPKVVQATMGAIFHVKVLCLDLEEWLSARVKEKRRIFGTFTEGENLYGASMGEQPVVLFGNESHGLSNLYDRYLSGKIAIPPFFTGGKGPESLNVASSVAVFCSEIRSNMAAGPTRSEN